MNKAFVREPEPDDRSFCPKCGVVGISVGQAALLNHLHGETRSKLGSAVWFCPSPNCDCVYFDLLEQSVLVDELLRPVYPKSIEAPICACFGFTLDDLDAAISSRSPVSLRELLAKSKSKDANCAVLSADGRCCMQEVQRLYIRGIQ